MAERHVITVPGKPYAREIDVPRLCSYLRAKGWTDHPELVVPHEPKPHLYVHPARGGQVYFAEGWDARALSDIICKIADVEDRHPVNVLDDIAASRT